MKKFRCVKKITAYLIVFVMLLSCLSVNAYDKIWDEFAKYNNVKENTSVESVVEINGSGKAAEDMGLSSFFGTKISVDMNSVIDKNGDAYQGDGGIKISFPPALGAFDLNFDMWLDLDISSKENFKYRMILKTDNDKLNQLIGDKYLNIDFAKDSNTRDEIFRIVESLKMFMPTGNQHSVFEDESIKEELYTILDPIKPIYKNGEYVFSVSIDDVKNIILNNRQQIKEMCMLILKSMDMNTTINDNEFDNIIDSVGVLDIFGNKTIMTLNIKPDINGKVTDQKMNGEINIEFNLYDVMKIMGEDIDFNGINKADGEFSLNLKISGNSKELSKDYKVDFPVLDLNNSINLLEDLPTEVLPDYESETDSIKDNNVVNIFINNNMINLDNTPVVVEDRTFVPLRELSNLFGISDDNIFYDEKTEEVIIKSGDTELKMKIGSTKAEINGQERYFGVPLFTLNDRTYIPVRFVSEMFGKKVDYTIEQNNGAEILNVLIND